MRNAFRPAGRAPLAQDDASWSADELGVARHSALARQARGEAQAPPRASMGNAKDDAFSTNEATNVTGSVFADNGNGADVTPGAVIAVNGSAGGVGQQITLPSGALLTLNGDGSFIYNPNDAFDYTPSAGSGASNLISTDQFTYTLTNGDIATVVVSLSGLDNNDLLLSAAGAQTLTGGVGNDTYGINHASDVIVEAASQGFDAAYVAGLATYTLGAGIEVEWLALFNQLAVDSQSLTGNEFANYILGNEGSNTLDGGGGADFLYGFGGNDSYVVDDPGDMIFENDLDDLDTLSTTVSYTLTAGARVETINVSSVTSTFAIDLTGNSFNNNVNGNWGVNMLNGGAGADRLTGYRGDDTYIVDNAGDVIVEAASEGFDAVYASVTYTLAAGAEVEWLSTATNWEYLDLNLTGNEFGQYLIGGNGRNSLNGGGGADIMIGLDGDDDYIVDNANDVIVEVAGQGVETIFTSVSYTLSAGVDVENLWTNSPTGTAAINLTGNELTQHLLGNNGNNVLNGGAGPDTMNGFGGRDTYIVDDAGDVISGGAGAAYCSVSYVLGANGGIDWLSTSDNAATVAMDLTGNSVGQYLIGNAGANVLDGAGGGDILIGLGGADTFAFTTALGATNVDVITDFVAGTDKIALDDAIFTQIGATGPLAAGAFVTGTAAGDADDRIIYDGATGRLYYDADGSAAGAAIHFATLASLPVIAASDITVI